MLTARIRNSIALAAPLASFFLARPACAQCISGRPGFQNVSVEPGNSFQAQYLTTIDPPVLTGIALPLHPRPYSVARDSEGRVRVERFAGKYKVKTPEGAETETERVLVSICDPLSHASVQLDSASKTATVNGPRFNFRLPPKPDNRAQQSFCIRLFGMRRNFPRIKTEDLGHQLISGFDAQGLRTWFFPQAAGAETNPPSSYEDQWCSDELGAVVLQVYVSGRNHKSETLLQSIERREPDPSVFQIPPDYTILERSAGGNRPPLPHPLPAPSTPSTPQ